MRGRQSNRRQYSRALDRDKIVRMSESPNNLHWYQFSLRSFLGAIALIAIALAVFFERRSLQRMVDQRLHSARLDQAAMIFDAQLRMAEERFHSKTVAPNLDVVIARDWKRYDTDELRLVKSWDFTAYPPEGADQGSVRREIRDCLEPVDALREHPGFSHSEWLIKEEVNFVEPAHRGEIITGEIIVTAEFHALDE